VWTGSAVWCCKVCNIDVCNNELKLIILANIMELEGRDAELVGFVGSFLRESRGSEAQMQRAKKMRAHAEARLARRPRKEEKRR
jgi:hypothetical protein